MASNGGVEQGERDSGTVVWDVPLRLWHWTFALCLSASLYTGLAGDIALMERHQQLGYTALGLLLFRAGWGLWGGRYARLGRYRISPREIVAHFRGRGRADPHTAPGRLLAVGLWLLVAGQVATGLFATDDIFTEGPLARYVSSDTARDMTWIHHRVCWLIITAIAIHLTAHLVYAARRDPTPLAMFTGRKPVQLASAEPLPVRAVLTAVLAAAAVLGFLAVA